MGRAVTYRPGTVERAYQLAKSGEFETARQIKVQLDREGYIDGYSQISGVAMARELGRICRARRAANDLLKRA